MKMPKISLNLTNLREQKKFIVTVSVTSVILLVWLLAIQLPLTRNYHQARSKLEGLEVSNTEIRALQSRLGVLVEQRNKSVKNYAEILRMIPGSEGVSQSVSAVSVLASEHNLRMEMFNPSAVSIESEKFVPVGELSNVLVEKYPIDVSLEGDYRDFGFFLDDLKKLPYLYTVKNLIIQPTITGNALKLDMVIYAYLQREVG
ncbi:MAG: type 4a pilus biogenesis protein PilO [Candidatus Neomarinimicrobiota bacterium]